MNLRILNVIFGSVVYPKNYRMKRAIIVFLFLFSSYICLGQNSVSKWKFGAFLNATSYQGDLGNGFGEFGSYKYGIGLEVTRYFTRFVDITGRFSYSQSEYTDENGTYSQGAGAGGYADSVGTPYGDWGFKNTMQTLNLNLKFKVNNDWILPQDASVKPYLVLGLGVTNSESDIRRDVLLKKKYSNASFYYGIGSAMNLSEKLQLFAEIGLLNPATDVFDGIDKGTVKWKGAANSKDNFLQLGVGIQYLIYGKRRFKAGGYFCD